MSNQSTLPYSPEVKFAVLSLGEQVLESLEAARICQEAVRRAKEQDDLEGFTIFSEQERVCWENFDAAGWRQTELLVEPILDNRGDL